MAGRKARPSLKGRVALVAGATRGAESESPLFDAQEPEGPGGDTRLLQGMPGRPFYL